MFNKKGGMQLSVNMIVILIIAVIIMGLTIGLITGLFDDVKNDLLGISNNEPIPSAATATNLITSSKGNSFILNAGEKVPMKWSVYCASDAPCENLKVDSIQCDSEVVINVLKSSIETIEPGSSAVVSGTIQSNSNTASDYYICYPTATYDTGEVIEGKVDWTINIKN
jgi:hypothetical protein